MGDDSHAWDRLDDPTGPYEVMEERGIGLFNEQSKLGHELLQNQYS